MPARSVAVPIRKTLKSADLSARSTWEVFRDHLQKRKQHALEEDIEQNYADDVVLLTGWGVYHGKEGVRRLATRLHEQLPAARYRYRTKLVEGEKAFLEWEGFSPRALVRDGADSYLIHDGRIVFQTIHYTVEPAGKARKRAAHHAGH